MSCNKTINPLITKNDLKLFLDDMINPIGLFFCDDNTQLRIGSTGTITSKRTAEMEALIRPLWGIVPAVAGGEDYPIIDRYLEAISNGTNPEKTTYWGDVHNTDQKMVEMAALGLSLAIAPEKFWDPLSDVDKSNYANWLNQINDKDLPRNNWRFFIVLVNLGLMNVGADYDNERLEKELDIIDSFYLGDGWYSDGVSEQRDYYVSFAIHFYSLIYNKLMREKDPERSKRFKERSNIFALDFLYWFGSKGDALPYGRSLTYRFAQCAFWSSYAYSYEEGDSIEPGIVKGVISRHLRHWVKQDIFNLSGLLSIGYNYENLLMAEGYNAPGSPYWALKSLLILALPDDNIFWTCEEMDLPKLSGQVYQEHPHMVITRESSSHLAGFTAGQYADFEPAHMAAKYEKFVYSNHFGFSVSKGSYGLNQGAFDNMLALAEAGDYNYRERRNSEIISADKNHICSIWHPWKDVKVTSWIVTGLPWHFRIHHIITDRNLDLAEGGFAISRESGKGFTDLETKCIGESAIFLSGPKESNSGCSGIVALSTGGNPTVIPAESNTNIINSRTNIPTVKKSIEAGSHWFISAVYGSETSEFPIEIPVVKPASSDNTVCYQLDSRIVYINLENISVEMEEI